MAKVDRSLQKLVILIQTGDWSQITEDDGVDVAELKLFSRVRDELMVNEEFKHYIKRKLHRDAIIT